MLYWLTLENYIVTDNPYYPEKRYLINEPKDIRQHSNRIGACRRSLQLLQLFNFNKTLRVWELEDNTGNGA